MSLLYCIILKTRELLVIARPAQAKSKDWRYMFIEEVKKFIHQLKPQPKYQYEKNSRCLSRKGSRSDPRLTYGSDVSFCQKDWEELTKATEGTASVLQFIPTTFSSTSVTTSIPSCRPTV